MRTVIGRTKDDHEHFLHYWDDSTNFSSHDPNRGSSKDEGYETDSSETSSLCSTLSLNLLTKETIDICGRTYHRDEDYWHPVDHEAQELDDLKHAVHMKRLSGNLHLAPINAEEATVLDLGTGTGIWAIDFADKYPNANVYGVDLSPIQPDMVPPNLRFLLDDVELPWWYRKPFDYIHSRHNIQGFRNWPKLLDNALAGLKPGGWIECQEFDLAPKSDDDSISRDNWMVKYWDVVAEGLAKHGVTSTAPQLQEMMEKAGFVNVEQRVFKTPIGTWAKTQNLKEVGIFWREALLLSAKSIALAPLIWGSGWTEDEVDVLCAETRSAYTDKSTHAYMCFYVVYGQKPHTCI